MSDERRAARLLRGEDAPSVIEREEMSAEILERVGAKRVRRPAFRFGFAAVAAAAAIAALVIAMPDDLTPRSAGDGVVVETICRPGPDCSPGDELLLRVSNHPDGQGYLGAFALREDDALIWYVPKDEDSVTPAFRNGEWIGTAVVLGDEHTPGSYEVYTLISPEPIDRDTMRPLVEAGGDEQHPLLITTFQVGQ